MKLLLAGMMALVSLAASCAEDRGTEVPPVSPYSGSWVYGTSQVVFLADSTVSDPSGVLGVPAPMTWFDLQGKVYVLIEADYSTMKLKRAKDPISFAGSAWPLALIRLAVRTLDARSSDGAFCFTVDDSERCLTR